MSARHVHAAAAFTGTDPVQRAMSTWRIVNASMHASEAAGASSHMLSVELVDLLNSPQLPVAPAAATLVARPPRRAGARPVVR